MDVSIILPCVDESEVLEESVNQITKVMNKTKYSYEIIIAEDGSTDGTDKIAARLANENNNIIHLHSDERLGRGMGVERGINVAKGKAVGFIDADLQTPADYIPLLAKEISNGYDLVNGKREYHNKGIDYFMRLFLSTGYKLLVRLLFRVPIMDTAAGFKFFNRENIFPILNKIKDKHWFWDTEIVIISYYSGLNLKEVKTRFYKRNFAVRKSKANLFLSTVDYLRKILELRFRLTKLNKR